MAKMGGEDGPQMLTAAEREAALKAAEEAERKAQESKDD